ncbi:MFS transporter [Xanthobacteraceae bacterium Astr-EGSB]|uniref:MFS transporter n=1 Tax=Astrobacterium formosum TaxID=3069710 RepID=UPI0027B40C93|nr:MFS transporter [Xanthobacteraceae bacterium Astr-EGSB]
MTFFRTSAVGTAGAMVATSAAAYVFSQLLRNCIAVIAPDLARELSISAAELGILASSYFFAFAAMQLPLGIAIDRWGPKACMIACAGVVVASCLLFAVAPNPAVLIAARILMGAGTSCYLMAPLALYARRFPPERFASLAGLQMAVGSIGTLLATAPLAVAASAIGWRSSFVVIGAGMALMGLLLAVFVHEPPLPDGAKHGEVKHRETLAESVAGIRAAARMRSVGCLFVIHFVTHASFVLFVGLWGGPYLTHVYGYGLTQRGTLLLIPALTQIIGLFVFGFADRLFGAYKPGVTIGAVSSALLFGVVAIAGRLPSGLLPVWLALFGFCLAYTSLMIAHGKSLFPPHLVGRGMTLLNMGSMGGAFIVQSLSGFVIGLFAAPEGVYPLDAYRTVFALQGLILLAAVAVYRSARDPLTEGRSA